MLRTTWAVFAALAIAPALAAADDHFSPIQPVAWRPLFQHQAPCCPSCVSPPSEMAPSREPSTEATPMPGQADTSDAADLPSFGNLALAEQGVGGGAGTMILGRADALNRFNLFDNMGAEPVTRVWFAFQAVEGLNPNVVGDPALGRPNQNLYRFGMEYAFSNDCSLAAQGMYNVTSDTGTGLGALEDSWSNPQFMLKRVVYRNTRSTLAATLGIVPEVSTQASTINESFSRIQPGAILLRDLGNDWFAHGGAELNLPLKGNATNSVDWVVSLGKWLYRHESLDGGGDGGQPWIVGVTAQVEALGKHVVGDSTITDGFFVLEEDSDSTPTNPIFFVTSFDFEESRHVVDATFGTNLLFYNDTALGLGYSFPLTGNEVRRGEFILSYNIFF